MAGIKNTKIIRGQPHLLTYITPNEVEKLKALGGQETMTPEGIPAYPESEYYGVSQSDFKSGNFTNSTDDAVRNLATGKTGVSAASLAAARINKQQEELKKIREEKERQALKKQLEDGPVTNYSTNYFVNSLRSGNKKVNKLRQKLMQDYIRRTKDSNLEELGMIDSQGMTIGGFKVPSLFTGAASAFKVDPNTKYFDEDSIREIGSQLQYTPTTDPITGKTTYGMTSNQAKTLGDLRQDIQFENNPNISQNDFNEYMNRNKIFNDGPSDDNNIPFIPINYNTGAGITDDERETQVFEFDPSRFGPGKEAADVTRASYIFNQGGRVPRNMGGIMNAVPRQGYFLGGIGKAIKSVVGGVADAAGKVLKSPLGQAAIIGLGGYYAGGGFGRLPGGFNFKNIPGAGFLMGGGKDGKYDGSFNPFKVGILGAAALPFFMKQPEDPDIGMSDRGGSLTDPLTGNPAKPAEMRASLNTALANANGDPARIKQIQDAYAFLIPDERLGTYLPYRTYGVKDGGRIGKAEGGLMDLGGMEKDYRAEGGFVPIGREEKADDVPARLSVNEFVFTADAVRNAGGGDIDKGAEVMENMMKNLENGGTVSEESQGNTGAQEMFSVSERIGEVI
jgi:hypothetical protein